MLITRMFAYRGGLCTPQWIIMCSMNQYTPFIYHILTSFCRLDKEERCVGSHAYCKSSHSASVGVVRVKGSNIDGRLHSMECPRVIGDDFCYIHQVETKYAIEMFSRNWAPPCRNKGGGKGGTRGSSWRCSWNCE